MTKLASAASGSVRIIAPRTTGELERFVLLGGGGAASAGTVSGSTFITSAFTVTGSWSDVTGCSVSLPSAGTYLVTATTTGELYVSAMGSWVFIAMRLASSGGVELGNSAAIVCSAVKDVSGGDGSGSFGKGGRSIQIIHTASGPETIKMQATRGASHAGSTTWSASILEANATTDAFYRTGIFYAKLG
jgi:hypothetical protein